MEADDVGQNENQILRTFGLDGLFQNVVDPFDEFAVVHGLEK